MDAEKDLTAQFKNMLGKAQKGKKKQVGTECLPYPGHDLNAWMPSAARSWLRISRVTRQTKGFEGSREGVAQGRRAQCKAS